ncbi:hypothetical protein ABZ858_36240 [Streptomyces sp. NPDC047017]|uniref:hypothetical protein n=1 Tax=Streptomyces sp. NPDC047017 TaxID=3155024 RepID=UPI00340CE785
MLAEFVVQPPHHAVVLVFGYRDGGQEPGGAAGLLGDSGQFGGAQRVQNIGDSGARVDIVALVGVISGAG